MDNNDVAASLISRSWEPKSNLLIEDFRKIGSNAVSTSPNQNWNQNLRKKPNGRLELIVGPMFASKTTELIRHYNRYKVLDKNILAVNHTNDAKRYGSNNITSHNHEIIENCYSCENLNDIRDLEGEISLLKDLVDSFKTSNQMMKEIRDNPEEFEENCIR